MKSSSNQSNQIKSNQPNQFHRGGLALGARIKKQINQIIPIIIGLRTELPPVAAIDSRHGQLQGSLKPLTFLPRLPWCLAELQGFLRPLTRLRMIGRG